MWPSLLVVRSDDDVDDDNAMAANFLSCLWINTLSKLCTASLNDSVVIASASVNLDGLVLLLTLLLVLLLAVLVGGGGAETTTSADFAAIAASSIFLLTSDFRNSHSSSTFLFAAFNASISCFTCELSVTASSRLLASSVNFADVIDN